MQVCTSLQTDNHANTPPLSFFTGRMPFLPPNQQRQSNEGNIYKKWKRNEENKPAVECAAEAAQHGKEIARRSDGQMLS